jgi:cytoskeletal protein RodZ
MEGLKEIAIEGHTNAKLPNKMLMRAFKKRYFSYLALTSQRNCS